MANKRFPTDTPYKETPHINDGLLLSDSEASHQSKMTTVQQLLILAAENLDVSTKADRDNVLELNQIDAYIPTEDYHPATKKIVDDNLTAAMEYTDSTMSTHIVDLHALSGTHIADIASLSGAIDTDVANLALHMADVSNPHVVTKAQVGLSEVENYSAADLPISDDTQAALDLKGDIATRTYSTATSGASGSLTANLLSYDHHTYVINGDTTFEVPIGGTNIGDSGVIVIQQDDTGGHTIDFDYDFWVFPAGAPVENTTADAYNFFRYTVVSEFNILTEFVADWVEQTAPI